jgi:hypothetical protein
VLDTCAIQKLLNDNHGEPVQTTIAKMAKNWMLVSAVLVGIFGWRVAQVRGIKSEDPH